MKRLDITERKVKQTDSLENKTVLARYDLHGYYYEGINSVKRKIYKRLNF